MWPWSDTSPVSSVSLRNGNLPLDHIPWLSHSNFMSVLLCTWNDNLISNTIIKLCPLFSLPILGTEIPTVSLPRLFRGHYFSFPRLGIEIPTSPTLYLSVTLSSLGRGSPSKNSYIHLTTCIHSIGKNGVSVENYEPSTAQLSKGSNSTVHCLWAVLQSSINSK